MRYIIFANGLLADPQAEAARWIRPGDLVLAADGGTAHALAAGLPPDHVIGDLDSLPEAQRARLPHTTFHPYPPAKDETDLELALLWAAAQAKLHNPNSEIVILGALGGRPDQALANLLLLALPALRGLETWIADGAWTCRLLRGGETLRLHGDPGDTLSLLPLGGPARGVTTEGLAYPLTAATLDFGPARGVSNIFTHAVAAIHLETGWLWCFHQRLSLFQEKSPGF